MKKLTSILIQISIFVSLISFPANALSSTEFSYEVKDGYIAITGCISQSASIDIPQEIESLPVKEIADRAFADNAYIKTVNIADSVKVIGDSAFENCTSLNKVNMPSELQRVGKDAFLGTGIYNNLANWTIREVSAGYEIPWEFIMADELETLYIGEVLICARISGSYTVKGGTKLVADGAFEGSSKLKKVTLAFSVQYIGKDAFAGCNSLAEINILNSNICIESGALADTALYKDSRNWQSGAFCINNMLIDTQKDKREIDIPENINFVIGKNIFNSYVLIPESVTYIDESAFYGDNAKAFVTAGSYAEDFCISHGISIVELSSLDKGDLNFDGEFNAVDYAACKSLVLSSQNPGLMEIKIGDVDKDGFVDGFDAIAIDLISRDMISFVSGDVTGDKLVGKDDIQRLKDIIYGNESINDQFTFDRCDINGDGVVDGFDLIALSLMLS